MLLFVLICAIPFALAVAGIAAAVGEIRYRRRMGLGLRENPYTGRNAGLRRR